MTQIGGLEMSPGQKEQHSAVARVRGRVVA